MPGTLKVCRFFSTSSRSINHFPFDNYHGRPAIFSRRRLAVSLFIYHKSTANTPLRTLGRRYRTGMFLGTLFELMATGYVLAIVRPSPRTKIPSLTLMCSGRGTLRSSSKDEPARPNRSLSLSPVLSECESRASDH